MFSMLCLISGNSGLYAQEEKLPAVTTSANIDLVSRYVWRGLDLGPSPNIQPGLSATWKDFTIGAWGTYSLTGSGGQETDFFLSKKISFITITLWDYWGFSEETECNFFNYRNKTTGHLLEAQILLTGGETLPFNFLASYFFYGADPSRSVYLELQYAYSSKLADLLIFAGYQARGTFYAPKPSFVNLGCTVKKTIPVTDRFSLPISLSLIASPPGKQVWLVAGITI